MKKAKPGTFTEGNKMGGRRPGSGRKPGAKTILARLALAELDEEAEKSIRFLVNVRDNDEVSWGVRKEAAKDLIELRFGKPKQAVDLGDTFKSWGDALVTALTRTSAPSNAAGA